MPYGLTYVWTLNNKPKYKLTDTENKMMVARCEGDGKRSQKGEGD